MVQPHRPHVIDLENELRLLAALYWQARKDAQRGDAAAGKWLNGGDFIALLGLCGLDISARDLETGGFRFRPIGQRLGQE